MNHEIYLKFCHLGSSYSRTCLSDVPAGCEDQSFQKFIKDSYFSINTNKVTLYFNHLMPNEVIFFYYSLSFCFISNTSSNQTVITKYLWLDFINQIFVRLIIITQLFKNYLYQNTHLVN